MCCAGSRSHGEHTSHTSPGILECTPKPRSTSALFPSIRRSASFTVAEYECAPERSSAPHLRVIPQGVQQSSRRIAAQHLWQTANLTNNQVASKTKANFGPRGVRVNAVSPGPTRTEGTDAVGEGALDRFHDEPEFRLPMPARYNVDKQGIIRAADMNADYTIRPKPSATLRESRTLITAAAD